VLNQEIEEALSVNERDGSRPGKECPVLTSLREATQSNDGTANGIVVRQSTAELVKDGTAHSRLRPLHLHDLLHLCDAVLSPWFSLYSQGVG